MTHASLFSGIGGAELAALWMGWKNLFHCEINQFGRKVLNYWFPESKSYEDITKTDFKEWKGKVDVLTGGFPCQPFSQAGKRKGDTDDRYLWPQMLRVIREIQPTWVVGENVAGITSMVESGKTVKMGDSDDLFEKNIIYRKEQQFTIERICKDFEHEGYSIQPVIIPACAVGAPHRRDRVWFVALCDDAGAKNKQTRSELSDEFATVSNPDGVGSNRRSSGGNWKNKNSEVRTDIYSKIKRFGNERAFTNSKSSRSERKLFRQSEEVQSFGQNSRDIQTRWQDFPTQSPVCGGNDGLPFDVDDLTISLPKWRQESIR
jgi:DNA (cytosine-5)-methyltransferase 1